LRNLVIALVGIVAGLAIAVMAVALEHSRIAFGPNDRIALYGNGALIALELGVPLAIYFGWTALARADPPGRSFAARAAAYAIGLDLGIGTGIVINTAVSPEGFAWARPLEIAMSLLLGGATFVGAVIGGLLYWAFASGALPVNALTLAASFVIGVPFGLVIPLIPMGLMAGAGVAAADRARTPAMTATIAVVIVVLLLAPFALVLFAPNPP